MLVRRSRRCAACWPAMTKEIDQDLRDLRKMKFLETYALTGVVQPACDAADISRSTYKLWRREDEDFAVACEEAYQSAVDTAEVALRDRAVGGIDEPVLYKGEPIWKRNPDTGAILLDDDFSPIPFTITKRSDRLLEVYMKANRAQYRDKGALEITGRDGGPLKNHIEITYVLPDGKTVEDYDDPVETDPLDY